MRFDDGWSHADLSLHLLREIPSPPVSPFRAATCLRPGSFRGVRPNRHTGVHGQGFAGPGHLHPAGILELGRMQEIVAERFR